MFSRMSAVRFEKERASGVGPGHYEIPMAFTDDHAAVPGSSAGPEQRPQEGCGQDGGMAIYEDEPTSARLAQPPQASKASRKSIRHPSVKKENRTPLGASNTANLVDPGAKLGGGIVAAAGASWKAAGPAPDAEQQLRRRLAEEERLRAADAAVAKKAAANARVQLLAKDKKLEDMQKKLEELTAAQREAQRRIFELDNERGLRKKALYEKEQAVAALQKTLSTARAQLEERGKRLEELRGAGAGSASDVEHLRREVAALREQLARRETMDEEELQEAARDESIAEEGEAAEVPQHVDQQTQSTGGDEAWAEVHGRIGGLEQRLATHASEASEGLRTLAKAHNRLTLRARERLAVAERRAAEAEGREARLSVRVAVKQVLLGAALRLQEREAAARREAEAVAQEGAARRSEFEHLTALVERATSAGGGGFIRGHELLDWVRRRAAAGDSRTTRARKDGA